MRVHPAVLALFLATALAACATEREAVVATSQRDLTVTGPREDLERFVALQGSRRPPLATSAVTPLDNGRASAIVTIPAGYSGEELVQTTREARAAGLRYQYADAWPSRPRRR